MQKNIPRNELEPERGIEVTEFYAGQSVPVLVRVSFSLTAHDWCTLQASDAWIEVEKLLGDLQKKG